MLTPQHVAQAQARIAAHIHRTPLHESQQLNAWLGHRVVFKYEGAQKTGAFKIRGALNHLLSLKEAGALPQHVVAFSSGNHAQAVAYGARLLGIEATICMPRDASAVKRAATRAYGAHTVHFSTRAQAEAAVHDYVARGAHFIHPYDDDAIIAGQGTACLEALQQGVTPDAIVASCGGGGWLSGTYLAAQLACPGARVIGAEPLNANDAAQSLRAGKIIRLDESPHTVADGVRTLAVSPRSFHFLQQLDAMMEVQEERIIYWTQWLTHVLKVSVEPTSALAMAGAVQWMATQPQGQTVLVLLSGGNISARTHTHLWAHDHLCDAPRL